MCVNIYMKISFIYAKNVYRSEVRYPTDVKSLRFWSQLEASRVSNHNEELLYYEKVCL